MLGYEQSNAHFALEHVETICTALSEFPVQIADIEDVELADSFGEISIFPNDPDVELV